MPKVKIEKWEPFFSIDAGYNKYYNLHYVATALHLPVGKQKHDVVRASNIADIAAFFIDDDMTRMFDFGYPYDIGETTEVTSTFENVLLALYQNPNTFSIPDKCRDRYSEQELALLDAFQKRFLKKICEYEGRAQP